MFRAGNLPEGRLIGLRLIRFCRDAVLEQLGISPPPAEEIVAEPLRIKGLAGLLRVNANSLYEQLHMRDLVLPDEAWVIRKPATFSRRRVLQWLGGSSSILRDSEDSR